MKYSQRIESADLSRNPKGDVLPKLHTKSDMQNYVRKFVGEHSGWPAGKIKNTLLLLCDCHGVRGDILRSWQVVLDTEFPTSGVVGETRRLIAGVYKAR